MLVDHIYVVVSQQFEADRVPVLKHMLRNVPADKYTLFEPFYKGRDNPQMVEKMIRHPLMHHISEGAGFLYLSFYKLMKTFLASEHKTVLVLESDILADDDAKWLSQLDRVVEEVRKQPNYTKSITFCGNGCGMEPRPETVRGDKKILYEMNGSKCCDSMIWHRDAIEDIAQYVLPMVCPIDIWLSNVWYKSPLAQEKGHKAYWIKPTIFTQGSQNGMYKSNVQ